MGVFNFIKGQFIDVIEWVDDSANTMVWKFPDSDKEIKNGAQLTVRESQVAIFLNEGNIGDVFQPGRHTLTTQNIPILTSLKSWKFGLNSPFKADVYFINTKQFLDQKWGTTNPIMMRDKEFGAIRLRGFGIYSYKISDPVKFLKEALGTKSLFTTDELSGQLKRMVISSISDYIAEAKIPALDLAMNYDELSKGTAQKLNVEFANLGLSVSSFYIENLSLPEEVEKMLDKKTSMGIMGNLDEYAKFQMADSIDDFAKKEGGNSMVDMGVGLTMGNMMGNMMGNNMNKNTGGTNVNSGGMPPPIPGNVKFFAVVNGQQSGPFDLAVIKQMISSGQVTKETLVWKDGMASWSAAGSVSDLSGLFGGTPPPIPNM